MAAPEGPRQVEIRGGQGHVIGDHATVYQTFAQAPVPIASHIRVREFATLVAERTRHFIGREYIFSAIGALIESPDFPSGYILIRGEPGIGKTALLAELVRRHGHVHHFNIASQNIRSPRDFLSNVCAQLIVRYELGHAALPPDATSGSGFLSRLLAEAVERAPDHRVVVLVDALDEADDLGLPLEANRLFLPPALPGGVHIVATSRELYDYRLTVDAIEEIALRDDDPRNRRDIARYIVEFVATNAEPMEARLHDWGVSIDDFAHVLTERSQGNFMYLVAVLRDIRAGRLGGDPLEDLSQLPNGLRAYYQRHWRSMRAADPERFEALYQPVICTLAVTNEPVSVPDLTQWTSLSAPQVAEVLREWREFLNEERVGGETRYRLYHASFQDFLRDEVALGRYHESIAAAALRKIPGL